jgi:hypothetical protein
LLLFSKEPEATLPPHGLFMRIVWQPSMIVKKFEIDDNIQLANSIPPYTYLLVGHLDLSQEQLSPP